MSPESSSTVGLEKFKSDFYVRFYGLEDLKSQNFLDKVEHDVHAFFGEKLFKPRVEKVFIGKDGQLDPNYLNVMQNAINYWRERGDEKATERFEKELDGAKNVVKLVLQSKARGSSLPVVINASDPGEFYVDKEGNKKSVTFVWTIEEESEDGWNYRVFSLPTPYLGVKNHWEILKKVSNLLLTERMLGYLIDEKKLDALSLISFPVVLDQYVNSLDSIASELGFKSWNDIEGMASNQLALESDYMAPLRRERIVKNFAMRIWFAIKNEKEQKYQEALVAAMADTMAVEAGKRAYLGMNPAAIDQEIEKNVQLSLALHYDVFKKTSYQEIRNTGVRFDDLSRIYAHATWINHEFLTNSDTRQARSTGCGGSGNNYELNNSWRNLGTENYNRTVLAEQRNYESKFGSLNEYVSSSDGEPAGKYPGAEYKPGKCVACGKQRQKVWHSENGGCGCCTTCEQELSGGD